MSSDDAALPGSAAAEPGPAPIEGITLERYAEIAAHLAVQPDRPRPEVLAALDLDEPRWAAVNAGWTQRLRDEVVRGAAPGQPSGVASRYPLSQRYASAFSAAAKRVRQEAWAPPAPPPAPEPKPVEDPRSLVGASNVAARAEREGGGEPGNA